MKCIAESKELYSLISQPKALLWLQSYSDSRTSPSHKCHHTGGLLLGDYVSHVHPDFHDLYLGHHGKMGVRKRVTWDFPSFPARRIIWSYHFHLPLLLRLPESSPPPRPALLSITEPLSLNEVLLNEEGDFPTSFVKINFFPLYINLRSFQICNNKEKGERKMATLLLSCCSL